MRTCNVVPGGRTCREVVRLYRSAFPAAQRRPFAGLWLLAACRRAVSLRAYYDGKTFCGFTLAVSSGKYLYISFIAVNPAARSRGYGSQILAQLRREHPEQAILVEVEYPDPQAENYEQRCRRIEFYRRNGFYDLNRTITGHGATFALMSTDPDFDRAAYQAVFPHLSFGLRRTLRRLLGRA